MIKRLVAWLIVGGLLYAGIVAARAWNSPWTFGGAASVGAVAPVVPVLPLKKGGLENGCCDIR